MHFSRLVPSILNLCERCSSEFLHSKRRISEPVNAQFLHNRTTDRADPSQRDAILSLMAQRIARLSPERQKILAMYYHENMQTPEIAALFNVAEAQIREVHAQTVALLRNDLVEPLFAAAGNKPAKTVECSRSSKGTSSS